MSTHCILLDIGSLVIYGKIHRYMVKHIDNDALIYATSISFILKSDIKFISHYSPPACVSVEACS